MKFERDEIVGICASLGVALLFFIGLRYDVLYTWFSHATDTAPTTDSEIVTLTPGAGTTEVLKTLQDAITTRGKITKLIIEDTRVGTGTPVENGSKVTLNYIGTLQDGTTFDNSYIKGEPYSLVVGAGTVIKGWDLGLVGMKVGGQRILVIPPALAYGDKQVGPIPPQSTLLFSVELLSVE